MNRAPSIVEQPQILSVSQLNRRVRQLLETHLSLLWVEGELTNLARPSSGHWYFTLKDGEAQVRCAMFRRRSQPTPFTPENGQQVLVRCRVGLYENRGDYQLIVEHMEPSGHGVLQRQFELLKARLAAEGLFAAEHKRPLPAFPRQIGVITSPTGAAIRDILHVLERRFPAIAVLIFPTAVQGADAAGQIIAALAMANRRRDCDLLILSRGGGSLEDLAPFNDEGVARAIAASVIPVISGVGHETDTTIADFVADVRAPTPSAAAELATPDRAELLATLAGYESRLLHLIRQHLHARDQQLESLNKRLRHPGEILARQTQHLDHMEIRLCRAMNARLHALHRQVDEIAARQAQLHPQRRLELFAQTLEFLRDRAALGMQHIIERRHQDLAKAASLLQVVSPFNTLARGYAIVQDRHRHVVSSIAKLRVGESVSVTVNDGSFDCSINDIQGGQTS